VRKGYYAEHLAKRELISEFGSGNVIKVAIGGAQDFIIIQEGCLKKVIEVKECHQKKYYPSLREKNQMQRMILFCSEHHTLLELWIRYSQQRKWDKESIVNL
jgi:hypothetical protein